MMNNQTVTHYAKRYDGDATVWTRSVLSDVYLSMADGQTMSPFGVTQQGGSVLMVFCEADANRISAGDYVVSGVCPEMEVAGNPVKRLAGYNPMRVSGRKCYPFQSEMAHATYTLEGNWA